MRILYKYHTKQRQIHPLIQHLVFYLCRTSEPHSKWRSSLPHSSPQSKLELNIPKPQQNKIFVQVTVIRSTSKKATSKLARRLFTVTRHAQALPSYLNCLMIKHCAKYIFEIPKNIPPNQNSENRVPFHIFYPICNFFLQMCL